MAREFKVVGTLLLMARVVKVVGTILREESSYNLTMARVVEQVVGTLSPEEARVVPKR